MFFFPDRPRRHVRLLRGVLGAEPLPDLARVPRRRGARAEGGGLQVQAPRRQDGGGGDWVLEGGEGGFVDLFPVYTVRLCLLHG